MLGAAIDLVGLRRARREPDLPARDVAGEGHHQLFLGHGRAGQSRAGQSGAKSHTEEKRSDRCAQIPNPRSGVLLKTTLRKIVAAL